MTAEDLGARWQFLDKNGEPNPKPVYRLTREGKLKAVELGRYRRYRIEDVEAFEVDGGTQRSEKPFTPVRFR